MELLGRRDALTADFQRFYGLRLSDVLHEPLWCADLARWLPADAAVWRAVDPRAAWSTGDYLAAMCVDALRWLVWAKSKDGQKNRRQPKPIPRPGAESKKQDGLRAMPVDQMRALLARPRGKTLKKGPQRDERGRFVKAERSAAHA